ncbi:hypothetical protein [Thiomicrorhabdus indica]|uniref:hypothetical protein n=1 Tax=Thiomicrorhabdus indica TaxID=2267253 RepID=UPI00102DDC41|nr:hypothetical protein [Thiomicrorhabdus indica]
MFLLYINHVNGAASNGAYSTLEEINGVLADCGFSEAEIKRTSVLENIAKSALSNITVENGSEWAVITKSQDLVKPVKSVDPVTVCYLVKGAVESEGLARAVELSAEGQLEFLAVVSDLASHVDDFYNSVADEVDYVFAYDLVEPFGDWVAWYVSDQGYFPVKNTMNSKLRRLHNKAINL